MHGEEYSRLKRIKTNNNENNKNSRKNEDAATNNRITHNAVIVAGLLHLPRNREVGVILAIRWRDNNIRQGKQEDDTRRVRIGANTTNTEKMKTAEELANEKYYDIPYPKNIASVDDYTTNEIRLLQRIAYVAGYNEAMRWRDPKETLPKTGESVIVKYRTAKNVEKHGIGRYFYLGIGNPWTIEGSTGREVIGWRPIE